MSLVLLARVMGTSVRELEDTYVRWLTRTDDQVRAALDTYERGSVWGLGDAKHRICLCG